MKVLVAGGAGYIGSITTHALMQAGHEVVVYDSLAKGHRKAVPKGVRFFHGDIEDTARLLDILVEEQVEAIVHFAAYSLVGESGKTPFSYYFNNVCGTLSLLSAARKSGTDKIVFSSTAAVYGEPEKTPIQEDDPKLPVNVYGRTKLAVEWMLQDFYKAHDIRSVSLRYFNACGALPDGSMGEDHSPETHLIPLILQAALGEADVSIYGDDYPTPDGTCIRDYVHVLDLAEAHVLALEKLEQGYECGVFNVGYGKGFSVQQVVDTARQVTGVDFPVGKADRREGDPAILVADSAKIKQEFGWTPKYDNLEDIIKSAWLWHSQHPEGYGEEK